MCKPMHDIQDATSIYLADYGGTWGLDLFDKTENFFLYITEPGYDLTTGWTVDFCV